MLSILTAWKHCLMAILYYEIGTFGFKKMLKFLIAFSVYNKGIMYVIVLSHPIGLNKHNRACKNVKHKTEIPCQNFDISLNLVNL